MGVQTDNKGARVFADCRALSAGESQFACLCETHAAHSGADACHMLPSGLRLRAAAVDSMMKLQAAGGLEAGSHAMSGVVSTSDPTQTALEPPHLCVWSIALARVTRCGLCAAVLGSEPTR